MTSVSKSIIQVNSNVINNNGYDPNGNNPWWKITNDDIRQYANKYSLVNKNICNKFSGYRLNPWEVTIQLSEHVLTEYLYGLVSSSSQANAEADIDFCDYEFKIYPSNFINLNTPYYNPGPKDRYHYLLVNKSTKKVVAYNQAHSKYSTPIPASSKFNSNNELGWLPDNHPERIIFWLDDPKRCSWLPLQGKHGIPDLSLKY